MINRKLRNILITIAVVVLCWGLLFSGHSYTGTDDLIGKVTKQYASAVGVKERPPLINTNRGDLLLFLFTISGLCAGFYLGYQWRDLFGKNPEKKT